MKLKYIAPAMTMGLIAACSHTARIAAQSDGKAAPAEATSPLALGRALYARQEYALAIEKFNEAVREMPDKPEGYNALAASYDMMGRYDVSRRYYELALARAPADGRIYRNMARSLRMQGREGEALAILAEWDALSKDRVAVAEVAPAANSGPPTRPAITSNDTKLVTTVYEVATAPKSLAVESSSVVSVAASPAVPRARTSATIDIPAVTSASPNTRIEAMAPPQRSAIAAIRIMNGVGKRGLARGVQTWLGQTGWAQSRVGDLDRRFNRSYIVFPKSAEADALTLSRHLPFSTGKVVSEKASRVVLILGRNAASFDPRSIPGRSVTG